MNLNPKKVYFSSQKRVEPGEYFHSFSRVLLSKEERLNVAEVVGEGRSLASCCSREE